MDVISAAYNTAHDYDQGRGCEPLAPKIGLTSAVLRNKVNPNNEHNHLRLDEAMKMQEVTGDYRIAQAMAQRLGGVFIKLPDVDVDKERCIEDLVDLFMAGMSAQGEACTEFMERKADGVLCKTDRSVLIEKANEVIVAMQKTIQLMED